MTAIFLEKLFEHHNWANSQLIQACSALTDEQLDAEPQSATLGSIRRTLWHLVVTQEGYLSYLTGIPARHSWRDELTFAEIEESARISGDGLLTLARDETDHPLKTIQTQDGIFMEPWVVMVQAINHATEHREQINSMISALGMTPLNLDGWSYGRVTNALGPVAK